MKYVILAAIFITGLLIALYCHKVYVENQLLNMRIMRAHINKLSKRYMSAVHDKADSSTLNQYLQELQTASDIYNKTFSKYEGFYDIWRYVK